VVEDGGGGISSVVVEGMGLEEGGRGVVHEPV
jgi:hypothetical protein